MTDSRLFLAVGLPNTGKTTFLAALWHLVDVAGRPGSLALESLEGDRTYLNEIRDSWLGGNRVPRTHLSSDLQVKMRLRDGNVPLGEFVFPDLAGEAFIEPLETRAWDESFDRRVRTCEGILLFIHPGEVTRPVRIDDANRLVLAMGDTEEEQQPPEQKDWGIRDAPTQVQLVDLLQCILFRRQPDSGLRVGVVISAWDLVRDSGVSPAEYLRAELPLLEQFLASNKDQMAHRLFGVSAQGGTIEDSPSLLALDPVDRLLVVGDGVVDQHDLTEPIKWLAK